MVKQRLIQRPNYFIFKEKWDGTKPFDNLKVFLKDIFWKNQFLESQQSSKQ